MSVNTPVPQHEHGIDDLPIGNGAGKVPLSSSIRTGLIAVQSADSAAIASTDVLTYFTGAGTYTLPANTLAANEVLKVTFEGTFEITGTPTIILAMSVGGVSRGTSAAATLNAAGRWAAELTIVQLAAGAARMFIRYTIPTSTTAVSVQNFYDVQGMDPTVTNVIVIGVQWSAASASNTTTQVFRTVSREAIFSSAA